MATILLIIIYISYIGLGLPDSLFGTAWPAIYIEFGISISTANIVTFIMSVGTVISSLLSARLINKLGTGILTAISTSMTALALLGFAYTNSLLFLCIFGIPLGLGAGAIDSAQNNYVAKHYNATHMNFLHCFYGVGVSLSPYLMSIGLSNNNWRSGYLLTFFVQAVISIITIIAIPLWKKAHPEEIIEQKQINDNLLPLSKMIKMPAIRITWLIFLTSCSIEATCTQWSSSYLVNAKSFTPEISAKIAMLYFVGLALGRFVSGLLAKKLSSWKLIRLGCCFIFGALILLSLPFNTPVIYILGLFFTGFGIGPIFPNMTYLTPINFDRNHSQAVIGSQMAFSYIAFMFAPVIFGFFAKITTKIFPYYLIVLFLILIFSIFRLIKLLKKQGRYELQKI